MRRQITITLNEDLLKKSKKLAIDEDLHLNDIIENALYLYNSLKEDDVEAIYSNLPNCKFGSLIMRYLEDNRFFDWKRIGLLENVGNKA